MNRADRSTSGLLRDVCLAFALLAIGLRILIPVGFMPGERADHGGVALVLCTAQGAISLSPTDDHGKAPAKGGEDGHCVFAASAAAGPEPTVAEVAGPSYAVVRPLVQLPQTDLAPGRGLAAPPLPARGPPLLLI